MNAFPKFSDNLTNHDDTVLEENSQSRQNWIPTLAIFTGSSGSLGIAKHCLPIYCRVGTCEAVTEHEAWVASLLWYLSCLFQLKFPSSAPYLHARIDFLQNYLRELAGESLIDTMHLLLMQELQFIPHWVNLGFHQMPIKHSDSTHRQSVGHS